jgi:hypothetical protein
MRYTLTHLRRLANVRRRANNREMHNSVYVLRCGLPSTADPTHAFKVRKETRLKQH